MHAISTNQLPSLYAALLSERETAINDDTRPMDVRLQSVDQLHFLDWQACRLLRLADIPCTLHVAECVPSHVCARIAARVVKSSDIQDDVACKRDAVVSYQPGVILERFLAVRGWSRIWHDYLTSRDAHLPPVHAGRTLAHSFPHVRTGFITGIDLFHQGGFYQAHEDWESLWMRLDGRDARESIERHAAQGLIQLSGAHLHRLKGRHLPAVKLYLSATRHLRRALELDWLDVPQLLNASAQIFDSCHSPAAALDFIVTPFIPLRLTHTAVARKHL